MKKLNLCCAASVIAGIITTALAGDAADSGKNTRSGEAGGTLKGIGSAGSAFTDGWDVTGVAGCSLASGNADSMAYNLQFLANKKFDNNEINLGADYLYAEQNNIETTNTLRVFGQYNRLLTESMYLGFNASYLSDDIASLDYRVDVAPLLGYYFIKNDTTTLALEAGLGYTWEKQGGVKDKYVSLRFAEKFTHKLNDRSQVWQSLIYTPEMGEWGNYNLIAEAGVDTVLTDALSVRTAVRHVVDSTPVAGKKKGDTTLTVGLAYALGQNTIVARDTTESKSTSPWKVTAALGYSLAKGNSDSTSLTAMLDGEYREGQNEFLYNAANTFAESNGVASIDSIRANAQYNRLISEKFYYGAGAGYLSDKLADLDYRVTPRGYAGMYLIKNDTATLSFEVGPGYAVEKQGGISDNYLAVYAGQKFTYEFSGSTIFNQAASYNAEVSDFENYTLELTAHVDTKLSEMFSFRVAASYIYDNQPAATLKDADTTITTGLAVKF